MGYRRGSVAGWTAFGYKLSVVFNVLSLAGCVESAYPPEETVELPLNGPELHSPIDNLKYPPDSQNDDLPGMIVTGLDQHSAVAVSPWLVTVKLFRRESRPSSRGDVSVELTRYADDFPVFAHVRFFRETLDTCVIRNAENEEGVASADLPPSAIQGGENVVLNMPSGPWLTLKGTLLPGNQTVYRAEDLLDGSLPAGVTLSIPGDAFPTVPAYPLFEPEPLVRLWPDRSQPITAESRFSWLPLTQSSHVKIDFLNYDEAGEFQGYPVSCWVTDDGSFELPEAVLEALEPWELLADSAVRLTARYSRIYSRVDFLDGIVYHQSMEIAE